MRLKLNQDNSQKAVRASDWKNHWHLYIYDSCKNDWIVVAQRGKTNNEKIRSIGRRSNLIQQTAYTKQNVFFLPVRFYLICKFGGKIYSKKLNRRSLPYQMNGPSSNKRVNQLKKRDLDGVKIPWHNGQPTSSSVFRTYIWLAQCQKPRVTSHYVLTEDTWVFSL